MKYQLINKQYQDNSRKTQTQQLFKQTIKDR
jgi:hypothetical protein